MKLPWLRRMRRHVGPETVSEPFVSKVSLTLALAPSSEPGSDRGRIAAILEIVTAVDTVLLMNGESLEVATCTDDRPSGRGGQEVVLAQVVKQPGRRRTGKVGLDLDLRG